METINVPYLGKRFIVLIIYIIINTFFQIGGFNDYIIYISIYVQSFV